MDFFDTGVADHLNPALRTGHGDFTATRTELEPVTDTAVLEGFSLPEGLCIATTGPLNSEVEERLPVAEAT